MTSGMMLQSIARYMQCIALKLTKLCIGWLIPAFPDEPAAVHACTDAVHTADALGVHLILDDLCLYCAGV